VGVYARWNMLRRVMVLKCEKMGHLTQMVDFKEAYFHEFGKNFEEFENGGVEFSSAIVEYDNGVVENVPAQNIRFLKRNYPENMGETESDKEYMRYMSGKEEK
jgi:hypothetical protein